jgi:hypothetical protein
MRFFRYFLFYIYQCYLTTLIFILILFKREIPKTLDTEFAKMIEEVKNTPITQKDPRS